MSRAILYFALAVLPVFIAAEHRPEDAWAWAKLAASGLYAGLLALKALQSNPEPAPTKGSGNGSGTTPPPASGSGSGNANASGEGRMA